MATELNHNTIKTKIATILRANASLYNVNDETKLLSIEVGRPNPQNIPIQLPGAFITNAQNLESIRAGDAQTNAFKVLHHTFRYLVVIGVDGTDSPNAETSLDSFQKTLLETLEADADLTGGTTAEVDLIVPESVLASVAEREGSLIQLRQITLRLEKLTA